MADSNREAEALRNVRARCEELTGKDVLSDLDIQDVQFLVQCRGLNQGTLNIAVVNGHQGKVTAEGLRPGVSLRATCRAMAADPHLFDTLQQEDVDMVLACRKLAYGTMRISVLSGYPGKVIEAQCTVDHSKEAWFK
jgi:hypothetical protein